MLTAIDDNIYLTGGFCAEHRAGMSSAELLSYNLPTETWSRPLCAGKGRASCITGPSLRCRSRVDSLQSVCTFEFCSGQTARRVWRMHR